MVNSLPPWATGPAEILQHGHDLLAEDSDSNRRLAMIAIDNSVELIIKTYLGLPKRITGLTISRKEYREFSENFPTLLDALEVHAKEKISGIDLGEIEWYHRSGYSQTRRARYTGYLRVLRRGRLWRSAIRETR